MVTSALPQMTTTLPWMTTTLPRVTSTPAQVTTTLPLLTTTMPQMTTTPRKTTPAPQCLKMPPPANGAMTGSNSYGDVVTFICNPGYKLVGTSTRTCQSDGTWSAKLPTCKATCRAGYQLIAQTCIRVVLDKKNYEDAQMACRRGGSTLAMPKTEELDVALRNLIVDKFGKNSEYWIGLKDCGYWQWEDGSMLQDNHYKGWNPGEPSCIHAWLRSLHCVQYWSGPTGTPMWDDTGCGNNLRYICQDS
ncbi:C-type lectin lectoxin-Lio3-like [Branchiostoma floridae x Branchiostoma japonicum]